MHTQTYKHFLAQKYAAESTSDSEVNNDNSLQHHQSSSSSTSTSSAQQQQLTLASQNVQQSFHQQISSSPFYPFSPLVSSSSHFGGVSLESPVDCESTSTGGGQPPSPTDRENAAAAAAQALFNENINAIAGFIKAEDHRAQSLVSGIQQTSTSNATSNGVTSTSAVPVNDDNIFDTVDSTTSLSLNLGSGHPSISSPDSELQNNHSHNQAGTPVHPLSSSAYAAFGYSQQPNNGSSVLTYHGSHQALSPSNFSSSGQHGLLGHNIENSHHHQLMLPTLDEVQLEQQLLLNQVQQHLPSSLHHHQQQANDFSLLNNHQMLNSDSLDTNSLFSNLQDLGTASNLGSHEHMVVGQHTGFSIESGTSTTTSDNVVISDVPVLTRARASLPVEYLYLHETEEGGCGRRLAVFARKAIPSKTQFGPIEGVIASYKNELFTLSEIALSAADYLHIFISESVLLNQEDENNSNWTRFVRPATSPLEQNIELVTREFADTNELKFFLYTTRHILPNEELKVWYSADYCARFDIRTLEEVAAASAAVSASSSAVDLVASEQHQQQISTAGSVNLATGGHKLRNKIAKSQQQQQLQQISSGEGNQQMGSEVADQQILLEVNDAGKESQVDLNTSSGTLLFSDHTHPLMVVNDGSLVNSSSHLTSHSNASDLMMSAENGNKLSTEKIVKVQQQYKCNICERVFPRQYSLRRHLVMHSGRIGFNLITNL